MTRGKQHVDSNPQLQRLHSRRPARTMEGANPQNLCSVARRHSIIPSIPLLVPGQGPKPPYNTEYLTSKNTPANVRAHYACVPRNLVRTYPCPSGWRGGLGRVPRLRKEDRKLQVCSPLVGGGCRAPPSFAPARPARCSTVVTGWTRSRCHGTAAGAVRTDGEVGPRVAEGDTHNYHVMCANREG